MKDIIYLDTAILHSFLAQSNDGLPTTSSNERGEEIKDTNEKEKGNKSGTSFQTTVKTGSFDIPFLFKSPEGDFKVVLQPGQFSSEKAIMSQTESGKEIISKQLHDNALEVFEKYLEEADLLVDDNEVNIKGRFIKCTSSFKIIDFKYLKALLQTEKIVRFTFYDQTEQIKKMQSELNSSPKEQRNKLKAFVNEKERLLNKEKQELTSEFSFIEEALEYLQNVLPTDSFLIMGNKIAPLKNNFLRETAKELMFKYGEESEDIKINMIAKVTRVISSTSMPDLSQGDPFFEFPQILNAVLGPIGIINKGDLVVSPIAIYFE